MDPTNAGRPGRLLPRALLIVVAAALLPAGSCEDNLGDVSPGPVSFRVSVGTNNLQAEGASSSPSCSADGRYVAFASTARNLALPSSSFKEVFVRDRWLDVVTNVTKFSRLTNQSDLADCEEPVMSPNGRYLAFLTKGLPTTIAIPDPPNPDIILTGPQPTFNCFAIDLEADPSVPISYSPLFGLNRWPDNDIQNISISDTGLVAFQTDATNVPNAGNPDYVVTRNQVFVCNIFIGNPPPITLISHAAGAPTTECNGQGAREPQISADGQFVVFASNATNLTADPTNARQQIYIAASDGTGMELVSRATGVAGATSDEHCLRPAVSGDGRYVAFLQQDNLVAGPGPLVPGATGQLVVRRDRGAVPPTTELLGTDPFIFILFGPLGGTSPISVSDDGQSVAFLRINAAQTDLEVIVSNINGSSLNAAVTLIPQSGFLLEFPRVYHSGDGRWVFWSSEASVQVLGDTNNNADIFGYGPIR